MTWNGNFQELLERDEFVQQGAFPVSSDLLTTEFVYAHVRDEAKQAVLLDLS